MNREERNSNIIKKIEIYTTKYAATRSSASSAIKREGLSQTPKVQKKKVAAS